MFKFKRVDKKTRRNIWKWVLNVVLTLMLIGVISGSIMAVALAVYIKNNIDTDYDIENLKLDLNQTTSIYYMDYSDDEHTEGTWKELEGERIHGSENRMWVSYANIPSDLIKALVSIEDKRFWDHDGVDWIRTAGAVVTVFRTGSFGYGGSTITQQLIKNVTGDDEVKVQRKIQEIFRALSLEKKRSKEEILEMYLNTIYLSQGCSGVQSAANYYFHKDVSELTTAECASLIAITNRPTYYDPIQNPENNIERRNVILDEMWEQGWLTDKEAYENAKKEELNIKTFEEEEEEEVETVHSWFVDTVIDDVINDLIEEKGLDTATATKLIYSGGLKIYTTMDYDVQTAMEEIYKDENSFPQISGVQPESAMVVMSPYNGNLLGIVGGRGDKKENRPFNRATMAKRQPGSSIKPLSVYSQGIEAGIVNYGTAIDDFPFNINSQTGNAWPSNSPAVYRGYTSVSDAVVRSVNTVAVRIADKIGADNSFYFLRDKYKLSTLIEKQGSTSDINLASVALGGFTYGVTLRDMATAYSTFANDGIFTDSRSYVKVLDSEDNIILSNEENRTVVLSHDTATVMTKILSEVVSSGTASRVTLKSSINCAAKTGTTNDNKDLYFAGYTPYFVGTVWYGYDQPRTLPGGYASPAMTVWDKVMTKIHQRYLESARNGETKLKIFDFSDLVRVNYCIDSGKLEGEYCKLDPRGSRIVSGWFAKDNAPTETCDCHVPVKWDKSTGAVAGDGCPESSCVTIALIRNENRRIRKNVAVTDAQYTYMELPENYLYPDDITLPFYMNLYIDGTFPGFTSGVSRPVNSFCVEHNHDKTTSWSSLREKYKLEHPEEEEEKDEKKAEDE